MNLVEALGIVSALIGAATFSWRVLYLLRDLSVRFNGVEDRSQINHDVLTVMKAEVATGFARNDEMHAQIRERLDKANGALTRHERELAVLEGRTEAILALEEKQQRQMEGRNG